MAKSQNGKHDQGVSALEEILMSKGYVLSLETLVEWKTRRQAGELDIKTQQGSYLIPHRFCYYEYKCNNNKPARDKGINQGLRYTTAMSTKYPQHVFYSIFVAGFDPKTHTYQKIFIISRNKELRYSKKVRANIYFRCKENPKNISFP